MYLTVAVFKWPHLARLIHLYLLIFFRTFNGYLLYARHCARCQEFKKSERYGPCIQMDYNIVKEMNTVKGKCDQVSEVLLQKREYHSSPKSSWLVSPVGRKKFYAMSVLDQRLKNHIGTNGINQDSSSRMREEETDFGKIKSKKSSGLSYWLEVESQSMTES